MCRSIWWLTDPPRPITGPHPLASAIPGGREDVWSANPTLGMEQHSAISRGWGIEKCDVPGSGRVGKSKIQK